ncbi:hypothetical protein ABGB07_34145 [Micromonosporaceae bacterium B7E4]
MSYLNAYPENLARSGQPYSDAAAEARAVYDRLCAVCGNLGFLGNDGYAARERPKLVPALSNALDIAAQHCSGLSGISVALPAWAKLLQSADEAAANVVT